MDTVVLSGDLRIPNSDDFPQNLAPFPEIYPSDSIDRLSVSPPHKLRPVRSSARSPAGEFPGDSGLAGTLAAKGLSDAFVEGWETSDAFEDQSRIFSAFCSSFDESGDRSSPKIEDPAAPRKRKRRDLEHFMESMVMRVMEKQERMHSQLVEAMEKMERERVSREEAWRQAETERRRKAEAERAEETSRNLSLITFLHNFLGIETPEPISKKSCAETGVNHDRSNKRWPQPEVQALVNLRTSLDRKFRDSGNKASVWEEVSAGMAVMDYCRSAKDCRQKWENMNKYFRRLTESGKKRSDRAKTCPYFKELDFLYKNEAINPSVGDEAKSERDSASPQSG